VPRLFSERLEPDHDVSGFRCGVTVLDRWLIEHAAHAQAMRTAQTFVWHQGDGRVVAYFSLAAHLVVRADLPQPLERGSPASIWAVLLARLGLDARFHGEGLGGELLLDALTRARAAADIAAARLVVVDAVDPAAAGFYRHHGFQPIPGNPNRLVQKVSEIVAALGDEPTPD